MGTLTYVPSSRCLATWLSGCVSGRSGETVTPSSACGDKPGWRVQLETFGDFDRADVVHEAHRLRATLPIDDHEVRRIQAREFGQRTEQRPAQPLEVVAVGGRPNDDFGERRRVVRHGTSPEQPVGCSRRWAPLCHPVARGYAEKWHPTSDALGEFDPVRLLVGQSQRLVVSGRTRRDS